MITRLQSDLIRAWHGGSEFQRTYRSQETTLAWFEGVREATGLAMPGTAVHGLLAELLVALGADDEQKLVGLRAGGLTLCATCDEPIVMGATCSCTSARDEVQEAQADAVR